MKIMQKAKEGKAIKGVGKAAEKASGQLASFDEINKLGGEDNGAGAGGVEAIDPDFSTFDTGTIKSRLDELTALLGGALLVIGAILTFSGVNIPLGIGMMALGAALLYKEAELNWGDPGVRKAINECLLVVGIACLVIGAVLAFSGANIPLGIVMMAVGAAALFTAAKLNWNELTEQVKQAITTGLTLVGMVALAVGLLLAFSGANIPLGIGLIAIGAASLAAAAALNWNELGNTVCEELAKIGVIVGGVIAVVGIVLLLTGFFPMGVGLLIAGIAMFGISEAVLNWDALGETVKEKLGNILAIVGGFLAAIGVVLLLSGNIPLGLGMLIAGAAALGAGSAAAQWDTVPNTVRDKLALILKVVGGMLFVVGLFLCITGVGMPIGLGLMLAGAAAIGISAVTANWGFIVDKVKEIWTGVKRYWSSNIAKYFTIEYWKGKASNIISGLVNGIKAGATKVKDAIVGLFEKGKNLFAGGGGGGGGNSPRAASPRVSAASIYPEDVPALAAGAVIPPNREFMAVLGDQRSGNNLEAPEALIRKIVREESGGMNTELLQLILEAIREGKVLMVDRMVLARTAAKGINDLTNMTGKLPIKI